MKKIMVSRRAALDAEEIIRSASIPPSNEMICLFINDRLARNGIEVEVDIATGFDSDDVLSDDEIIELANTVKGKLWGDRLTRR